MSVFDLNNELAQLRHLYTQLYSGTVKDQKQVAEGLLSHVIRNLEEVQSTFDDWWHDMMMEAKNER